MSTMNDFETHPEASIDDNTALRVRTVLGLVVAWAPGDPSSCGGWLPLEAGAVREFGRGSSSGAGGDEGGGLRRLVSIRQRPSHSQGLPPMGNPSLSRVQLIIEELPGALRLTNRGRLPLRVNGAPVDSSELGPGDVVELGTSLVLVCVRRPERFAQSADEGFPFGGADRFGIVGESAAIWGLRAAIERCAGHAGHILVLGETGSGKELVARALHASAAPRGELIARNAATIPEALVDAELFGNAKGYPTHGLPERPGLVGSANEGSLFLDEFVDLPTPAQAHLLRVLDSGEYHRLGESRARTSRFRLIAATSRSELDLRKDLAARFEFTLRVPSLAERIEDVPWLAAHLLTGMTVGNPALRARALLDDGQANLKCGFVARLLRHDFGGNTRELKQLLWRSLLADDLGPLGWPATDCEVPASARWRAGALTPSAAPERSNEATLLTGGLQATGLPPSDRPPSTAPPPADIQVALDANNGSLEVTYKALGLSSRHALTRLVRKYGLRVTRRNSGQ